MRQPFPFDWLLFSISRLRVPSLDRGVAIASIRAAYNRFFLLFLQS